MSASESEKELPCRGLNVQRGSVATEKTGNTFELAITLGKITVRVVSQAFRHHLCIQFWPSLIKYVLH